MSQVPPLDLRELPEVLVVDHDPDFRALAALHVQIAPGVRLQDAVATLPAAMDVVVSDPPAVVLVGLGRPRPMEREDLALLRLLTPATSLVVASIRGRDDARHRAGGIDAWFVDKLEVLELVTAISEAVASGTGVGTAD